MTALGEGASDGLLNCAPPLVGFAVVRTHLLHHDHSFAPGAYHAGAGGTRSRAISVRMSANICRGTAISAIWNAT